MRKKKYLTDLALFAWGKHNPEPETHFEAFVLDLKPKYKITLEELELDLMAAARREALLTGLDLEKTSWYDLYQRVTLIYEC